MRKLQEGEDVKLESPVVQQKPEVAPTTNSFGIPTQPQHSTAVPTFGTPTQTTKPTNVGGLVFGQPKPQTQQTTAPSFGVTPNLGNAQLQTQSQPQIGISPTNNTSDADVSNVPISPAGWGTSDVTDPNFDPNTNFNSILGEE